MSRRRVLPRPGEFPPQLQTFDVGDWWVRDPEDPTELQYARIRWGCARRAFEAGDDWQSHLGPPVWWTEDDQESQARTRGGRVHIPDQ